MGKLPKNIEFQETVWNDLGGTTGWGQHVKLTVGVHTKYTFNSLPVYGCIQIVQQSAEDIEEDFDDFRDMEMEASILTNAAGARKLAGLLLRAAEAAETVEEPTP